MTLAAIIDGANDAITAVLAVGLGAVLRGLWSMQQRLSRLEAMDEYRERTLDKDRDPEPADQGTEER